MTPGEELTPSIELITQLELLRHRLNESGIERTYGLREAMGQNCAFFKKSLNKFVKEDYVDIRNLVKKVSELFVLVERRNRP